MNIPFDTLSTLFGLLLVLLGGILWEMQRIKDTFDLRDIICEWTGEKQIVSTNKTLLAGAFLVSSYAVIKHFSDVSYAAYLAAWVVNGGIAAWKKVQETKP